SIAEVVAAIDGAMGMTQCSVHEPHCEREEFCPTRPHWQRINLAIGQALAAVTLADMAEGQRSAVSRFTVRPQQPVASMREAGITLSLEGKRPEKVVR